MENMHYVILILLIAELSQQYTNNDYDNDNPHTCLKHTQIIVYAPPDAEMVYKTGRLDKLHQSLMEDRQYRCYTLSTYSNYLRKIVDWEADQVELNFYRTERDYNVTRNHRGPAFTIEDTVPFINSLHKYYSIIEPTTVSASSSSLEYSTGFSQDSSSTARSSTSTSSKTVDNHILIFFQAQRNVADGVLSALEELDNKTDWDVILVCSPRYCLKSQRININKIIPEFMETRELMGVVRNPNFNRFEYLKHVKLHDNNDRLRKCLGHKNVHIVIVNIPDVPLKMLENIALLLYNTKHMIGTKIHLHVDRQSFVTTFWKYFLEKNGFNEYENFVFNADGMYRKFFDSVKQLTTNHSYLVFDAPQNLQNLICNRVRGRKSFVFFTSYPQWSSCVDRLERTEKRLVAESIVVHVEGFVRVDLDAIAKGYQYVYENLIEEIVRVSCL